METGVIPVEKLLLAIQHKLNPLHVYCRLVRRGIDKEASLRISRVYEQVFFRWFTPLTAASLSFCRLLDQRRPEDSSAAAQPLGKRPKF